jgi:hypothetical protein
MQHSTSRSRFHSSWPSLFIALACLPLTSCGASDNIERIDNTQRATTLWKRTTGDHVCLEYATAASKLDNRRANLAFPITANQNVQLSYENAESLASIYTVSDILQFGHAALYRLCEAAGNGSIDQAGFTKLVQETLQRMSELLEVQLAGPQMNAKDRIAQAWNRVQAARASRLQAEDVGQTDPDALDRAQRRLVDTQEKLAELLRIYGLEESFANLAIESNNLEKAWRELELAKSKLDADKGKPETKAQLKQDVSEKRKVWEKELKGFQSSRWLDSSGIDAPPPAPISAPNPPAPTGSAAPPVPTAPAPVTPPASAPAKKDKKPTQ